MASPTQAQRPPLAIFGGPRPPPISDVGLLFVAILLLWLAVNFVKTPADFIEIALIGLTTGCLYALVALGYTLVYGILELINFAHGDVFMLGGMISATIVTSWFSLTGDQPFFRTWPLVIVTLLVAMALCGLINATIELIAYRPLRNAPRLAPLI